MEQGPGDSQAFCYSVRESTSDVAAIRCKMSLFKKLVDTVEAVFDTIEAGEELQVLGDCQLRIQHVLMEYDCDEFLCLERFFLETEAVDLDISGVGRQKGSDYFQQRCFADGIWAADAKCPAGGCGYAYILQDGAATKRFKNSFYFNHEYQSRNCIITNFFRNKAI